MCSEKLLVYEVVSDDMVSEIHDDKNKLGINKIKIKIVLIPLSEYMKNLIITIGETKRNPNF